MEKEVEVEWGRIWFHWRHGVWVGLHLSDAPIILDYYAGRRISRDELKSMEPEKLLELLRSSFDTIFSEKVFDLLKLPYRIYSLPSPLSPEKYVCIDTISHWFEYPQSKHMHIHVTSRICCEDLQVFFDENPEDWRWKQLRRLVEIVWKKAVSRVWFYYSKYHILNYDVVAWKTSVEIVEIECNHDYTTKYLKLELPLNTIKKYYLATMLDWHDAIDKAEELIDKLASIIDEIEKLRHDRRELELELAKPKKRAYTVDVPTDTLELEI